MMMHLLLNSCAFNSELCCGVIQLNEAVNAWLFRLKIYC